MNMLKISLIHALIIFASDVPSNTKIGPNDIKSAAESLKEVLNNFIAIRRKGEIDLSKELPIEYNNIYLISKISYIYISISAFEFQPKENNDLIQFLITFTDLLSKLADENFEKTDDIELAITKMNNLKNYGEELENLDEKLKIIFVSFIKIINLSFIRQNNINESNIIILFTSLKIICKIIYTKICVYERFQPKKHADIPIKQHLYSIERIYNRLIFQIVEFSKLIINKLDEIAPGTSEKAEIKPIDILELFLMPLLDLLTYENESSKGANEPEKKHQEISQPKYEEKEVEKMEAKSISELENVIISEKVHEKKTLEIEYKLEEKIDPKTSEGNNDKLEVFISSYNLRTNKDCKKSKKKFIYIAYVSISILIIAIFILLFYFYKK